MVNGATSPSSSNEISLKSEQDKERLEFYQNRFDEKQLKDEKYKEKIDKHLRELIADRHELESEVLRKSEKISDLQRALVDLQLNCFEERERFLNVSAENEKLKRKEERLHQNIRELLNVTKEKDLRDRIIYVLEDPSVEISYRHNNFKRPGLSKSNDEILKEEIRNLQSKLKEYTIASKSKSDVILEDCKIALEKSKEKLLESQEEFRKLRKKLQETESELFETKKTCSELREATRFRSENDLNILHKGASLKTKSDDKISKSCDDLFLNTNVKKSMSSNYNHKLSTHVKNESKSSKSFSNFLSKTSELHLLLVLLSKIITKVLLTVHAIQSSQIYVEAANLPNTKATGDKYVKESDIIQLQNNVRQCTRLSYELCNAWKSVEKDLSPNGENARLRDKIHGMEQYSRELASALDDLAVATAEVDLLTINLSRATFFDYLTGPNPPFEKFGVKDMNNHSKYVSEVNKMEKNLNASRSFITKAINLAEKVKQKCNDESSQEEDDFVDKSKISVATSVEDRPSKGISKEIFHSEEKSMMNEAPSNFHRSKSESDNTTRETLHSSLEVNDVTRKINKALAKINHIESGDYVKDEEVCKHLGEEVDDLIGKLKELYDEFNVKTLHDQFSEYSAVTLSRLETLARQSRDAVLSAEAQISAHRSNAKSLSLRLKDTEEMLRESINECLSLKNKLSAEEMRNETDRVRISNSLHEKLNEVQDFDQLETAVKEVASSIHPSKSLRKPMGPYECLYCKQGSGHKVCDEKIKELRTNNRKLTTELKLLQKELKEEKKLVKMSQEEVHKATLESTSESVNLKGRLQSLESKNTSLLEQLKLERNRIKNMERFRRLEIEGFQTDIKNLKSKILDMEKQLMKAVLIFEHDRKDLEYLETIHTTAKQSKKTIGDIKRLKAKLYELETDIKHI